MRRFLSDPLGLLIAAFGLSVLGVATVMVAPTGVAAVVSMITLPLAIVFFIVAMIHQIRGKARRARAQTKSLVEVARRDGEATGE